MPPITLEQSVEEIAYTTILKLQPSLAKIIGHLIDQGQTPLQIAKKIDCRDAFLAAIAEMAAVHMQQTGIRPQ